MTTFQLALIAALLGAISLVLHVVAPRTKTLIDDKIRDIDDEMLALLRNDQVAAFLRNLTTTPKPPTPPPATPPLGPIVAILVILIGTGIACSSACRPAPRAPHAIIDGNSTSALTIDIEVLTSRTC